MGLVGSNPTNTFNLGCPSIDIARIVREKDVDPALTFKKLEESMK